MNDQHFSSEADQPVATPNVHDTVSGAVDVAFSQPETQTVVALLAHSELAAQMRLAIDASRAPNAEYRMAQSSLSGAAYERLRSLINLLDRSGSDGQAMVCAFDSAFDEYEQRTKADTWHERVLKGYVGHSVSVDFGKIVLHALPQEVQTRVNTILDSSTETAVAAQILSEKSHQDKVLSSRLALWGRRLVGEALNQIQLLVAEHEELARLVRKAAAQQGVEIVGETKEDNAGLVTGWVFNQLTAAHSLRMDKIGLAA